MRRAPADTWMTFPWSEGMSTAPQVYVSLALPFAKPDFSQSSPPVPPQTNSVQGSAYLQPDSPLQE